MIGIYLITNKVNGKKYVGQSIDIERRWKSHIIASKKSELLIYRAMRKYGIDNFDFSILEECSVDKLDEREIYWISELDTYNNGYNMTIGGEGHSLYLDPKEREQKKKEVARRSGKKYRDSHKEERRELQRKYRKNNPDYVKKWEEKHKEERTIMWRERARRLRMENREEFNRKQREYRMKKKLKNNINTL